MPVREQILPAHLTARAPVETDAPRILAMIDTYDIVLLGAPDIELDAVFEDWRRPGFSLEDDAIVILAGDQVVGYELILYSHDDGVITADGYVHPEFTRQGIGTYLLRWAEDRGRVHLRRMPAEVTGKLRMTVFGHDEKSPPLLTVEGYHIVRHHWRMEIDMEAPPPAPILPEGVSIRTFVPGQDEYQTWETVTHVFEEEWGMVLLSFEDWKAVKFNDPDFDPTLWWLAVAGDQIIGITLGYRRLKMGWISTFGIRREWRRQGIALALLHHAFREFYALERKSVGLGVDAQNPTGATRVYERAGMHAARVFDTYEKNLTAN